MADAVFDVVEQILVRLDVKDLIRYKSVCKSWLSFISTPRFVKAHLNHNIKSDRNNRQLGHRRIFKDKRGMEHQWASSDIFPSIVGSCNGLVCIFSHGDNMLLVTNPATREEKKLQTPPNLSLKDMTRRFIIWGFGYDSSSDDYKVIAGIREGVNTTRTLFHVLTLKSNTWKVIGELEYQNMDDQIGVLFDGALYWFMSSDKSYNKAVFISLDLSTEEFIEIPQPDTDYKIENAYYNFLNHRFGVIEDCLCIHYYDGLELMSAEKWVMKNNKWELCNGRRRSEYDVAYILTEETDSQRTRGYVYTFHNYEHYNGIRVSFGWHCIGASIFVKSLISPHPHVDNTYEGPNITR